jgi:hypothetical protein
MNYFTDSSLAESSVKLYNSKIQKWLSITPHKNILRLIVFHKESYEILLKSLHDTENTATNRHMYLSAIVALFNHAPTIVSQLPPGVNVQPIWQDYMVKNSESIRERRLEGKPTEAQEKKEGSSLTFELVCKIRDSLPDNSIDKLLIGFYTHIPCVRADYFATQIVFDKEAASYSNFISIFEDNASLVITDFKSKSKYKKIEHPSLPKELTRLLLLSLKDKPRKFLFVDEVGNPFTRSAFSSWATRRLSKLFNVKLTLTLLRHIYVSSLDMNMPTKELEKISSLMGHSLSTQRSYKWEEPKDSAPESVKNEVICGCGDSISICNSCNTITITSGGSVTQISYDNKELYKEKLMEIIKRIS